MNRIYAIAAVFAILAGAGCNPMATEAPPRPRQAPVEARRPAPPAPGPTASRPAGGFEMRADTPHDRVYAEYLRDKAGGMLRGARVGVERKQLVEVKLDRSVPPEDTRELTKSLLSGIRKEFPGKPFRLKVFDPNGKGILTATYDPETGVQLRRGTENRQSAEDHTASNAPPPPAPDPNSADPSEKTGKDREFEKWALGKAHQYLRYVDANLDREGKVWLGVTKETRPGDVKDLTRSLLEGAQQEFPRRELVATVFDPNGDKIGHATLSRDGSVDWKE